MKHNHGFAGIEVMRFFCAFGVLIWHYQHFFFVGEWNPMVANTLRPAFPLYRALSVFYDNGSLAVPFFWVISGFIFYWHYSEEIRERRVSFSEFILRRFSRLYPLHLGTLILVAIGQYIYCLSHPTGFIYIWNKPVWFASQLVFASNWFTREPESFNGPIWSVSIEILIYLTFFLITRTIRSSVLSAAFIAAGFAVCFNVIHGFINPEVFACGMYFFGGGVAHRLSTHRYSLRVSICAAAALWAAISFGISIIDSGSILFLAVSLVIIFAKLGETVIGVPFRFLSFLGNATYSCYLLHFPIQLALVIAVDAMGWRRDLFYSPSVFIGFLTLVVGSSFLVHRYFEMPVQRVIRTGVGSHLSKLFLQGG